MHVDILLCTALKYMTIYPNMLVIRDCSTSKLNMVFDSDLSCSSSTKAGLDMAASMLAQEN